MSDEKDGRAPAEACNVPAGAGFGAPSCPHCSHPMAHFQGAQWQCAMSTCPTFGVVVTSPAPVSASAPNACISLGPPDEAEPHECQHQWPALGCSSCAATLVASGWQISASVSRRCEYIGSFSDGSTQCGLVHGHGGPHYSNTERYPLSRETGSASAWMVVRATSARYLGAYEWVRNPAKAAHFITRETAEAAAEVARKSNGGVTVEPTPCASQEQTSGAGVSDFAPADTTTPAGVPGEAGIYSNMTDAVRAAFVSCAPPLPPGTTFITTTTSTAGPSSSLEERATAWVFREADDGRDDVTSLAALLADVRHQAREWIAQDCEREARGLEDTGATTTVPDSETLLYIARRIRRTMPTKGPADV